MRFSIEKASELVNKSVKTLYRHMAQSGLRYSVDENNNRKISLEELQSFYKIEIDQTIPDSQMRFSHENDIENKLNMLLEFNRRQLEIAEQQLAATRLNNELLEKSNEIVQSQMRIESKPEPTEQEKNTTTEPLDLIPEINEAKETSTINDIDIHDVEPPELDLTLANIPVFGRD